MATTDRPTRAILEDRYDGLGITLWSKARHGEPIHGVGDANDLLLTMYRSLRRLIEGTARQDLDQLEASGEVDMIDTLMQDIRQRIITMVDELGAAR